MTGSSRASRTVIADKKCRQKADEADRKFYEVYKSGGAGYLVTGNIKHFPKETAIVTPGDFIKGLR